MAENVQELLIRYKSDISDLKAKADQIETSLSKVGKAGEDAGKKTEKAFTGAGDAASSLGSQFENLGKTIIAAFAIDRIIAFGKESVKAFADSQKAQFQLLGALKGQGDIQQRLIKQADELQGKFGIDNDTIVRQQAFLALQGRSETQINKTIQAAIQLSSVTGEDLQSSIQKLDATYEGNIGRLGKLDSRFTELTKTQLANGAAVDLINEKYAGFAEAGAASAAGKMEILQRQIDDTEKKIGEKLVPVMLAALDIFNDFIGGTELLIQGGKDLIDSDKSILNPANWFKTEDALNEFNKTFKQTFDLVKSAENRETSKITEEIQGLMKLQSEQSGQARTETLATIAALQAIVQERSRAIKESGDAASETLDSLKKKLEDLKASQSKIVNPLTSGKAENDKILKEIADTQAKIDEITGEAAKKRAENAQKEADANRKRLEDEQKNKEALRKFTLKSLNDNITDEETAAKELAVQSIHNSETLSLALEQIDLSTLEKRRELLQQFGESTSDIDKQIADKKVSVAQSSNKAWEKANDDFKKSYEDWAKDLEKIDKDIADKKKKQLQDYLSFATDSLGTLTQSFADVAKNNIQSNIDSLEEQKTSRLAAIDSETAALEDQHTKKLISEREYQKRSAAIRSKREDEEKALNQKINAEKKKQAEIERAIALFNIALHIPEAITKIMAQLGIGAAVAIPIALALAAAQVAAVVSAPLPKFAKGTKGAHGAMSIVGEEGPEMMFVPSGAKILSSDKTKKYSSIIDAMYDNKLNEYLEKMYISPILKKQQQLFDIKQHESFAQNIANSFLLQKEGGLDEFGALRVFLKGNEKLPKEIAMEMSKLINHQYSAYN